MLTIEKILIDKKEIDIVDFFVAIILAINRRMEINHIKYGKTAKIYKRFFQARIS